MAAESRGERLGENFSPRHTTDHNNDLTIDKLIDELGNGILELGGHNKENRLLMMCLGLLEGLGALMEKKIEQRVQEVVVKKLDHLTDICKGIKENTAGKTAGTKPSYADVTASHPPPLRPPPPPRPILRTHIDGANKSSAVDILTSIKKSFNHAIAVHKLPSGDVDIRFDTQAHRDAAAGRPSPPGVTVFNKQYLVEIPSVPITVRVRNHRQADNTEVCKEIEKASLKSCGTFKTKSIRWLHDPEKQGSKAKTRGSLVLGVASEAEQKSMVQGGIVIGGEYYAARFFESALVYKQCFRCGQWGHKQGACARKPVCLQCAGSHDTRTCKEDRVVCGNCGKGHRAWQREPCPVFQRYRETIAQRRGTLRMASEACRSPNWHPALQAPEAQVKIKRQGRKRAATSEAHEAPRCGVGRPRHIEVAARDASQSRLAFGQTRPVESEESGNDMQE